jgi:hypothetical protein
VNHYPDAAALLAECTDHVRAEARDCGCATRIEARIVAALVTMLDDDRPSVRVDAIYALGALRAIKGPLLARISEMARADPSATVRPWAAALAPVDP